MSTLIKSHKNIYSAVFLTAFSSLAAEIIFSRLFSVITYYYLAFFALSIAMLGMTAGAITVFIKDHWFAEKTISKNLSISGLLYALSLPLAAIMICIIPVGVGTPMIKSINIIVITFFCALPFYFAGIIISAALTKIPLPVNRLYAADLIGAAIGCIFVLAGLELFDGPGLLILLGLTGVVIAFLADPSYIRKRKIIAGILFISVFTLTLLTFTNKGIRLSVVKGKKESGSDFVFEKWNSHSRVVVKNMVDEPPQLWGQSPLSYDGIQTQQYQMSIDGDAGTVMRKFRKKEDIEHLKYDLTNFAYYLRPGGKACIIGVGGGKDIQAAVLFNQKKITGIDVNPVFIRLLKNEFRDFAGIADRNEISLVSDEARSYLSRSPEKYSLIQMALIDTWAATGAGAFSLSENNLYTIEAWQIFLNRLDSNGLFTVSRWYNQSDLGETGRLISLAVASLHQYGVSQAEQHIALLTVNNLATLIVNKEPFSKADISILREKSNQLQFNLVIAPGTIPGNDILRKIITAPTNKDLKEIVRNHPLNLNPPTDDNPYFFNMLKLTNLSFTANKETPGIMEGNLVATRMLILLISCLMILTIATIILPLVIKTKKTSFANKYFLAAALYFSFIGSGFIVLEMALIQKLIVFLGRPTYALGILLFSIILSTGIGSLLSEKITPVHKKTRILLLPALTAFVILAYSYILPVVMTRMVTMPTPGKIITSILFVFPVGILLGLFFPLGLKLAQRHLPRHTPWFWALNGTFSVLFSAVTVFISIYLGITYNFYLAALFYITLLPLLKILDKE